MKINDIATGTITVEMQPDEAMDIAIACHLAEQAVYSGHTHLYRVLNAGQIGTIVPIPSNEGQVRELAPLRDDPDTMREVWREVAEEASAHLSALRGEKR